MYPIKFKSLTNYIGRPKRFLCRRLSSQIICTLNWNGLTSSASRTVTRKIKIKLRAMRPSITLLCLCTVLVGQLVAIPLPQQGKLKYKKKKKNYLIFTVLYILQTHHTFLYFQLPIPALYTIFQWLTRVLFRIYYKLISVVLVKKKKLVRFIYIGYLLFICCMFENSEPSKLIKLCNQLRIHLYEGGEIRIIQG